MGAKRRALEISAFLANTPWAEAQSSVLVQDASSRSYQRLGSKASNAILMDALPQGDERLCPPEASVTERHALGYHAMARLAGSNTRAFAALAQELVARGFSTPTILAADHGGGLLLLEDLGDDLFSQEPAKPEVLYSTAIETLAALARSSFDAAMPFGQTGWVVQDYDFCALLTESDLLLDWYAPMVGPVPNKTARAHIHALWSEAFKVLNNLPKVLVLRDVHAQNLLWLPEREGVSRVGLLDFQDALFGSPAYDLVSLLQDSRRDLPPGLEEEMIEHFLMLAKITDRKAFAASYAIVGAQRSAKVLGIFVRLAKRDGKANYLDYLPITARNFVRSLEHPVLADIRDWMQKHIPAVFMQGKAP